MMRNLKVLGIALVAVFAMSAIAASMASADDLTSETSPVTLTGNQIAENNNVLSTTSGTVKCKVASYTGASITTPTTTVTITPKYTECNVLGFLSHEPIDMNGCDYLLHLGSGATATTATADVVCPVGKEITATAISVGTLKCTIHIPPQTGLSKIEVTNLGAAGSTRELELHLEIEGIQESHTKGTGLGACTAGSAATGKLTGTVTVTGENPSTGAHVGIFLS
jgi:hypothetical protein